MGGAAGHMAHPYDLAWVNTGADLINFFELAKSVEGTVKIDGVNVSFKVVGDGESRQFAVDRGSLQPIDIQGVTLDRVAERFPKEGHGMRRMVPNLLNILNEALSSVEEELKQLGMWDDPSRFLNTEYVEGTTNVTEYDKNFLAIHGLNQFYEKTGKVGKAKGITRPGLPRPENVTAPSVEIPYNDKVMNSLVKKLNAVAQNYGFEVISEAEVRRMEDASVDFTDALNAPLTLNISEDRSLTKSLREWLSEVENPRYKLIKSKEGRTYNALHRELYYKLVEEGIPVTDLLDEQSAQDAIYGAVMVHAVRTLGNVLLRASTSDLGDLINHEGIVLRDEKKFKTSNPVKITGEFILGNLGGGFGNMSEQEDSVELDIVGDAEVQAIEDEAGDPVVDTDAAPQTVALVPGAFKPPHRGHADMVRRYATGDGVQKADRTIILISNPQGAKRTLPHDGSEVSAEHSERIWDTVFSDVTSLPGVEVRVADSEMRSPISIAYEYISETTPLDIKAGDNVILGASRKDRDYERWNGAAEWKKKKRGVNVLAGEEYAVPASERSDNKPFSASDLRQLISNLATNPEDTESLRQLTEYIPQDKIDELFNTLGQPSPVSSDLEEMSSGGGGTPSTGPAGNGLKRRRRKLATENKQTVDDVIRLLMERGIMS